MVRINKRGNVYQYQFDVAPVDGKRKRVSKSGFKTKKEAEEAGTKAFNEYNQTGEVYKPKEISYSDFLDYWVKNYCEINLRYNTVEAYKNIIKNHIKPRLGAYRLAQISSNKLQEFINQIYVEKGFSKEFLHNILKVLKGTFSYAEEIEYIKKNPASKVKMPRYELNEEGDPAHIFTKEEIDMILNRFKDGNHCIYYAFLTAYYTGLRVSEVFGLTWNDIDLENKTLTVRRNIVKKNQNGGTKNRHISGKSVTVWYFGPCKTPTSYRTIDIGDTLVKILKDYKDEQEQNKIDYGETYMKHYKKEVLNPHTNKIETKIVNAYAEIDVALPEVNLVFLKDNGVFEGTDTCKYPFKVIHYELGIDCRFHDFRDTHATKLIENGADIKAVSERLGHSSIKTTYDIYVKVTPKMKTDVVERFESIANF